MILFPLCGSLGKSCDIFSEYKIYAHWPCQITVVHLETGRIAPIMIHDTKYQLTYQSSIFIYCRQYNFLFNKQLELLRLKTTLCMTYEITFGNHLTHWGRLTHICVGDLTIIGSGNGLASGRRQAITWTNVGILLFGPLGSNFSEMLIEIHTFSFKKIHLKMSSGKWRPFCLGLNVLRCMF